MRMTLRGLLKDHHREGHKEDLRDHKEERRVHHRAEVAVARRHHRTEDPRREVEAHTQIQICRDKTRDILKEMDGVSVFRLIADIPNRDHLR